MGDLGKTLIFIGLLFITIASFSLFGGTKQDPLQLYDPYQVVEPTTIEDRVEVYDSIIDYTFSKRVNKPYKLVTASSKVGYSYGEPTFMVVDYGTYHEIDSLKCVRYKQMQWKMYNLDKLNEKSCE